MKNKSKFLKAQVLILSVYDPCLIFFLFRKVFLKEKNVILLFLTVKSHSLFMNLSNFKRKQKKNLHESRNKANIKYK